MVLGLNMPSCPLVWPTPFPCSCAMWTPSTWSILISVLLSPTLTTLFSPCYKRFLWTFGIDVGTFGEPYLRHHQVCVLDVRSDFLWVMCSCWKLSPWIRIKLLVPSGIISSRSCMYGSFLRWLVVTSVYLKKSCIHTEPLISCSLKRRSPRTLLSF